MHTVVHVVFSTVDLAGANKFSEKDGSRKERCHLYPLSATGCFFFIKNNDA
jgi:hypothetical protein